MTRPFRSRPRLTPDHCAALLISLVPFVYFFPAVWGNLVLAPDDGLIFNVPLRTVAAQLVRNGFVPLWDPYIFSGMPLHASVQAGLLFPLNWFFLIFAPPLAANLMVLTTYSIAGLGAYLYARRTGNTITGALFTSLAWQLGGVLIGQISHINIVQTVAMLPVVLWSIERFAASGQRRWALMIALMVASQTFIGHPQTNSYSLLLVAAYVVTLALTQTQLRRRYFTALALVVAGVLMAAVQILPTFELLRNSVRSDASYEFFTSFSMPARYVQTLFAPYLMGGGDARLFRAPYIGAPFYGEMVGYVGLLTIMLALIACLLRWDIRTKFWGAVAVIGFVLALGDHAPFHLYHFIYHIPVLSLFRVPARHLMEVDFALVVLAGRGLTTLTQIELTRPKRLRVVLTSIAIVVATIAMVTISRPAEFRLGREAPVTLLRAPELFLPIVFAILSAVSLLNFIRRKHPTLLLVVLVIDLAIWGQFSGWSLSPHKTDETWASPSVVQELKRFTPAENFAYRILTVPHEFDPDAVPVPPSISHSTDWNLWTQPNLYMAHGIQNAAGYDGFGLGRYSRLAGDMKVWGELTDPNRTLRGDSREIDILNVRYLISMRNQKLLETKSGPGAGEFPPATVVFENQKLAAQDLALPNIKAGEQLEFQVSPVAADRIALVTNLSWSENLPDGTVVARVLLRTQDGREFVFALRAGSDTSEWAHDRADIHARIRHRRAMVAGSYQVEDAKGNYEGHTYVASFSLPEKLTIVGGRIILEAQQQAPDLLLQVLRISLADSLSSNFYPLKREWLRVEAAAKTTTSNNLSARWRLLAQTRDVEIFENSRLLPRAWMTVDVRVYPADQILQTIRSGRFPDGARWDPATTALVEANPGLDASSQTARQRAEIVRYEPNRIEVSTISTGPSILVLGENHYPGWRAYVDGHGVDVVRVNYNLRGVVLPSGNHQVEFVYRPKSVFAGSLISLVVLGGLITWSVRRNW